MIPWQPRVAPHGSNAPRLCGDDPIKGNLSAVRYRLGMPVLVGLIHYVMWMTRVLLVPRTSLKWTPWRPPEVELAGGLVSMDECVGGTGSRFLSVLPETGGLSRTLNDRMRAIRTSFAHWPTTLSCAKPSQFAISMPEPLPQESRWTLHENLPPITERNWSASP